MSDELPPRPDLGRSRAAGDASPAPAAAAAESRGKDAGPGEDGGHAQGVAAEPGAAPEPGVGGTAPRPSANRRALGFAFLAVLVIVALGALVGGGAPPGGATFPPAGATTGVAGGAAAVTRGEVARALATAGLQVEDAARTYRPAEAPAFATAPRIVVRAVLAGDPDRGLIVIYEFVDPAAATVAAAAQAAYVSSGVGRVQFPNETRFAIRVLGSTAVFYAWSPAVATDPQASAVASALDTIGVGVPVPG